MTGFGHAQIQLFAEVRFSQDNNRNGAAVPGDCQVAFQSAQVEIMIQGHADKQGVDIGGDDLPMNGGAGRFAPEHRLTWQDMPNDCVTVTILETIYHDPVANCRIIRKISGGIAQFPCNDRVNLSAFGNHAI